MSKFRVLATQAQVAIHACAFHIFAMQAKTLEELWHHARTGNLSAWSEAKAWVLREVWQQLFKKDSVYGLNAWVAKRLKKAGGGRPTRQAIGQLFQKMDDDNKWFPGKLYGSPGGRPSAISGANKSVIARSAMAIAQQNEEPTYSVIVARNPKATLNPATGKKERQRERE